MTPLWPAVAEERWMELERRKLVKREDGRWRTNGLLVRVVLFVFTSLTIAAAFLLFAEWKLPKGILTAAICLAVAELLILRFRFFGTGVESALWIGGLFAIIFGLPGPSKPEALLLFAAACAIAGFRMRNAIFGAGVAGFVIAYLAEKHWYAAAAILGLAIGLVSLLALRREYRRPSTEMLISALLIIAPIAGAMTTAETLPVYWALAYVAAACACLMFGGKYRMHAPLIAAAVHIAVVVATLIATNFLVWNEWWTIIAGAILFGVAAIMTRELRGRTTGIVTTRYELTGFDDELRIASTVALQPKTEAPPADGGGGGGRFGGAGATGDY